MLRTRLVLPVLASLALLTAGVGPCGGDDGDDKPAPGGEGEGEGNPPTLFEEYCEFYASCASADEADCVADLQEVVTDAAGAGVDVCDDYAESVNTLIACFVDNKAAGCQAYNDPCTAEYDSYLTLQEGCCVATGDCGGEGEGEVAE